MVLELQLTRAALLKEARLRSRLKNILVSGNNPTFEKILFDAGASTDGARSSISVGSNELFPGNPSGGDSGDIQITGGTVVVQNQGIVSTATKTSGKGGNILFEGTNVTLQNGGTVTASSFR